MRKIFFTLVSFFGFISISFAEDSYLCISYDNLRKGNVSFDDVPKAINCITNYLLGFAGTIAMVMIIIGALKLLLGSGVFGTATKEKAKNTITYGIIGFIVALSSWFIVNLIVGNL